MKTSKTYQNPLAAADTAVVKICLWGGVNHSFKATYDNFSA
jgi:hypothetical protein